MLREARGQHPLARLSNSFTFFSSGMLFHTQVRGASRHISSTSSQWLYHPEHHSRCYEGARQMALPVLLFKVVLLRVFAEVGCQTRCVEGVHLLHILGRTYDQGFPE